LGYTVQLVSDAHTTHDKEHLSAEIIRNHHNITLSMGPTITAVATEDVELNG
jgi:S-ribosylhomocysteine lyase LuxS involved in autoinducer biosynthesis